MGLHVLITGGLGFIGLHTTVSLMQAGHSVVVADNLSNSSFDRLQQLNKIVGYVPNFYLCDLCNKVDVQKMFEAEKKFDMVIHFAAHKAVGESVQLPLKYFHNNLLSLIHLLECMKQYQCEKIVFSSSATVYGDPDQMPLTEIMPMKEATSAYGSTKQMGEEILEKVCRSLSIAAVSLRYFNPIGAHPSGYIGEWPSNFTNNLMPYILNAAKNPSQALIVYGNDYPTTDGTCIRDYVHVMDLAQAHLEACQFLTQQPLGYYDVFNVGTGVGTSVLSLISLFQEVNSIPVPYKFGERRAGDVAVLFANVDKAKQILGWKCNYGLQEMVAHAWKWESERMRPSDYLIV